MTASYAQTGDTLTCYTPSELEKIANKMVYANECDTLLSICEKQLVYDGQAINALTRGIAAMDSVVAAKESVVLLKEDIITGKEIEITNLRDVLKKSNRKIRWLKLGWATTAVGLTALYLLK